MEQFADLSREELLKLIRVYAKNWLAHDGCWFLAVEEKLGLNSAIELDARGWERFSVMEAKRIMAEFDIPPNGGLHALEKAFRFRLYSTVNIQQVEWVNEGVMIFRMIECRVQKARSRKNLPHFPCKPVGIVEYSQFATTIDPRIQTRCITCPPDPVTDCHCAWEFSLNP